MLIDVADGLTALNWQSGLSACFLSPHSDDAAFSAAGALLCLNRIIGAACEVHVAMSKSSFTPDQQDDVGAPTAERVTRLRQSEDRAFANLFADGGVTLNWLGFNDAPLRGYLTKADYQSGRPLIAYDLELAWAISEMVAPDLQSGAVVFAPLAVGNHIDHRIARAAALALKSGMDIELLLYEDMPYSTLYGPDELARVAAKFGAASGLTLEPLTTNPAGLLNFKCAAIEIYKSQVVASEREAILNYARELDAPGAGAERLWRVTALGSDALVAL